ncbi:hypothetical protein IJH19_00755 [Candidatus Saccharibacteria bacterium]|nr:hypothetical protein [Candidatus Saccharibacteria bacterium]
MQTENFKTKTFSNIAGPAFGTDATDLRKYYEGQLNFTSIPEKTLRKIYTKLKDPYDSHLATLSHRRSELSKELVAARVKAHQEETAASWRSTHKLAYLVSVVILPVLLLSLLLLEIYRAILALGTPSFLLPIGLTFFVLPAVTLVYILAHYTSWRSAQNKEMQSYLKEIDCITQKYYAAEWEYRNLTVMLEVIGNACRDEHEPRAA